MAEIKFENVSKSFGKTTVIENMNLTLPDGKFTVLLGPSGCGKTTLLRMIAGIGPESSGTVYMNGKDLKNVPPGERDIAMVFRSAFGILLFFKQNSIFSRTDIVG